MNKALLAPIVALFLLVFKQFFGIEFDDNALDVITDGILSLILLIGIFMEPKKGGGKNGEMEK